MIVERKSIDGATDGINSYGHIILEKLAKPESMAIYLDGEQIYPKSFDIYGNPEFTLEQELLFIYKREELCRVQGNDVRLTAEVHYEEAPFNVPRVYFDTYGGIMDSLISLKELNNMLNYRRIFKKVNKNIMLNEFMLFGCFYLDQFGQIMSIEKHKKDLLNFKTDVEYFSDFTMNNTGFMLTSGGFSIPNDGDVCPCCGKSFTIEDVKNNPCVFVDGKYYHDSCYSNYRRLREIDYFTRNLMSLIYKSTDYTFEIIPNGYCNQPCCSNIPWILFHTVDGDIIIGNRKRVISVEWQENYKKFDFDSLFKDEDVTKWNEDGKCGIHAWGDNKCFEYLSNVLHIVNPEYNKWK